MEQLVPSLVILYLILSVLSALWQRLKREPAEGEFGEETSDWIPRRQPQPAASEGRVPQEIRAQEVPEASGERRRGMAESMASLPAQHQAELHSTRDQSRAWSVGLRSQATPEKEDRSGTGAVDLGDLLSGPDGLKRAVLIMEILGPPKALRRQPFHRR